MDARKKKLVKQMDAEYTKAVGLKRITYWSQIMNRRMPRAFEIDRLMMILKGYYADFSETDESFVPVDMLEFLKTNKRPFGSKAKWQSIAYNLGWDYGRCLCFDMLDLPDFVEAEAISLYNALIEKLENKR
ncbi:hypothetical protein [Aeromonas phage phiWae14]|nr:hypothetical protein [Aeromonas phage phiWae14]